MVVSTPPPIPFLGYSTWKKNVQILFCGARTLLFVPFLITGIIPIKVWPQLPLMKVILMLPNKQQVRKLIRRIHAR